ncbi:nicotinate-nucleotide adenylyltransferase [Pandoraea thiooxydans]|uniref:Probable nicotinate-nucleotide adenylyltransferase n=1 Tax=Pandoraea thiooxydans TaxID=445709 RepID=A0A0G3EP05_9BURK|nr:nicotinate-nucleotide adenylyltransferase [Pandoraea thiooxydans]AKJ67042.1 nicotinate-nucleotide adenylyltransferase [Pandoraea thiooxydans]APR93966.1 nicotinate-nucleotide adenylyltransferase [Pandoraea thiooxydans]
MPLQHPPSSPIRRVGLLGGTFDPIHAGHLALGELFAATLALDELILMPAGQQPQKHDSTPAQHRLAMTRLAAAELAERLRHAGLATSLRVSTMEIERGGPSYTVDTLRELRRQLGPDASLTLLIGSDQLLRLDTWHEWQRLFEAAHIGVAARPGFDWRSAPPAVHAAIAARGADADTVQSSPCGHILLDDSLAIDISATDLRAELARMNNSRQPAGAAADLLAPILDYIQAHHLYRT